MIESETDSSRQTVADSCSHTLLQGCHQYADDIQLYIFIPSESDETVEILDHCLETVVDWMRINKLKLNPEKMEILCVKGSQVQEIKGHPILSRVVLPQKAQVCYLGVLLDSSLSFETHVLAVVMSTYFHLWLRPFLDRDNLAVVIHVQVTSRFDYCNVL